MRQQVAQNAGSEVVAEDLPLTQETLKQGWEQFIALLESDRSPSVQSFKMAELIIKDATSFEATATNNLQQRFLELERNKACEFLQRELHNRQIQFSVLLLESEDNADKGDRPLTTKQQYLKMIEQYPLVKELRERLRLDLDL
jgi:DNA polymerase-3 subunit gamma/tau